MPSALPTRRSAGRIGARNVRAWTIPLATAPPDQGRGHGVQLRLRLSRVVMTTSARSTTASTAIVNLARSAGTCTSVSSAGSPIPYRGAKPIVPEAAQLVHLPGLQLNDCKLLLVKLLGCISNCGLSCACYLIHWWLTTEIRYNADLAEKREGGGGGGRGGRTCMIMVTKVHVHGSVLS